jgi:hypothetical protein
MCQHVPTISKTHLPLAYSLYGTKMRLANQASPSIQMEIKARFETGGKQVWICFLNSTVALNQALPTAAGRALQHRLA